MAGKRDPALLVAVIRAVDEENKIKPRHQANGGTLMRWPFVASAMQSLEPECGWTPDAVKKVYQRMVKSRAVADLDALAESGKRKDLAGIVRRVMGEGKISTEQSLVARPLEGEEPAEPDTASDVRIRKLEKEASFYRKGYDKFVDERATTELVLDTIRNAIAALPPVKPVDIPMPTILLWNRPRVLVPLLSDMHVGETVDANKIKGFNRFNFEVLDERLDRWCTAVEEHFQHERAAGPVERIYLPIMGDMVTGENIYRGQWNHIEESAMHQIFTGSDKLAKALQRLSRLGVPIDVDGVGGNHARMGMKGESDFSNDFLMYQFLWTRLEQQPNIRFRFDYAFWTTAKFWDWRFYFCHGDNIRGWGGYPWYGTARADANTLQLMLTRGEWYHFFVHGHFHTDMSVQTPIGKRMANGNWIGATEYGVNGGFAGRPSQKLLVVTEKGGVETEMTLYLDEIDANFMNRAAAGNGLGWSQRPW